MRFSAKRNCLLVDRRRSRAHRKWCIRLWSCLEVAVSMIRSVNEFVDLFITAENGVKFCVICDIYSE